MTDVLERAFRAHYGHVYRYLRRRTRDDARAEELAQQVFVDAAAALPDFGPDAPSPLAWLYTVAHRRFVDEARRRARDTAVSPDPVPEYGEELTGALVAAFRRLTEDQRAVLAMKLVRGLQFREIAGSLGIGEGAVRMRFSRALAALRDELEREGVEP
ncbi:MAG TPA: sigma-70 family RNA polymerase sigma factor [Gaiellaceae bacterium]|nr:sigma-70 family RNA polymerase sigma factor [Gaiellaceae bacterium]